MRVPIPSKKLENFALNLHLRSSRPVKLRVLTYDYNKPYTKYSDRDIILNGERVIYLTFPKSPEFLVLEVTEQGQGAQQQSKNWEVVGYQGKNNKVLPYQVIGINKCDVWMDEDTRKFFEFAEFFSTNAGIFTANGTYSIGKFKIDYQDFIIDKKTNTLVNTPARIGHDTGLIHVARQMFQDYTVPQRLMILLHEFSHKYINPKYGKDIGNEFAADINALYIYLGNGYPAIDAQTVYLKVFNQDGVDAKLSLRRYAFIEDYIKKFKNNNIAGCKVK